MFKIYYSLQGKKIPLGLTATTGATALKVQLKGGGKGSK